MQHTVYRQLLLYAESYTSKADVTIQPYTLWIKNEETLNVDLQFLNIPKGQRFIFEVVLYDSSNKVLGTIAYEYHEIEENVYTFRFAHKIIWWNEYYLLPESRILGLCLTLTSQSDKRCGLLKKDFIILNRYINKKSTSNPSDCTNSDCLFTFDWKKHLKQHGRDRDELDKPEIGLKYDFKEWEHRIHVNITCSSKMNKFDILYIHQEQARGSPFLLHMGQYLENTTGNMKLSFNKKLINGDKNSNVFCVRESIDNSTETKSYYTSLYNYNEIFEDLEPSVINVSPPVAWCAPRETLTFVCSGTPTQEGRELTWYIQDSNTSAIQLPDSNSQKYNPETNKNILTLHMNETLLTKKLFCAEDFHIQIKYPESNFTLKRYGIRNESAVILKLREEEVKVPVQALIWGLAGGGAVLLLAIFFVIRARSRRRGAPADSGHEENEEEYYSTAQVKYVVLDLPQSQSGKPEQRADPSPYAKIVGVYNPGK